MPLSSSLYRVICQMQEVIAQLVVHFLTSVLATLDFHYMELRVTMHTASTPPGFLSELFLSMWIIAALTSVGVLFTAVLRDVRESIDVFLLAISV